MAKLYSLLGKEKPYQDLPLVFSGGEPAVPVLLQIAQDEGTDKKVRLRAIQFIKSPTAFPLLAEMVKNDNLDINFRTTALHSITT